MIEFIMQRRSFVTTRTFASSKMDVCLLVVGLLFSVYSSALVMGRVVVKDSKGVTLSGVSVFLKGSTTGTSTDADGLYSLTLGELNGTLVFSMVVFTPQEVLVA